jgi:LPXTG-motif cell wall-anchored protein
MVDFPWLIMVVGVLIILLAVIFIALRRKRKVPPDYYSFFWIGIIWMVIGIPLGNFF